jgi:hypothetical protein
MLNERLRATTLSLHFSNSSAAGRGTRTGNDAWLPLNPLVRRLRKKPIMVRQDRATRDKISPFDDPITTRRSAVVLKKAVPSPRVADEQGNAERNLQNWFRSIVQSNHDLANALERLRDSYRELLLGCPISNAHHAVLIGVEITLRDAENVRELN